MPSPVRYPRRRSRTPARRALNWFAVTGTLALVVVAGTVAAALARRPATSPVPAAAVGLSYQASLPPAQARKVEFVPPVVIPWPTITLTRR